MIRMIFVICVMFSFLTQIADPYRWLEDADAEDTKQFVDAQNALTVPFLENCSLRTKLHDRCTAVDLRYSSIFIISVTISLSASLRCQC